MGSAPTLPDEIQTGCPELDLVWARYARSILDNPGVLIPDTDKDLTWHAFLGHSIDMQGFRAAEFAGVDSLTRTAPEFVPLIERGIGVPELAELWSISEIREHLLTGTKGVPLQSTLEVLRSAGGSKGASLAEAFQWFPWRKFHWAVRALLQNSAALANHGYSFRRWLEDACGRVGAERFPPPDFRRTVSYRDTRMSLEHAIRRELQAAFYQVGPTLASYMICDWQLWLWKHGRTAVFSTFKADAFHEQFVSRYGRGLIPSGEEGFSSWWLALYPEVPPRLANECIWIGVEHKVV